MSTSNAPKLSLKVAINKQKSKVLFAEAGGEFVDVLLSFLTLPLGKIFNILKNRYGFGSSFVGSIASLTTSIWNLYCSHYCVEGAEKILYNPRSWREAELRRLKLDITNSQTAKYFVCGECSQSRHESSYISLYSDVVECNICGMLLKSEMCFGESDDRPVFMMKESSFIITDDLRVVPVVTGFLQTINTLGITDADDADLTSLTLEMDDIFTLLKLSLTSSTPLSDLIIKNKERCWASRSLFHPPVLGNEEAPNSGKMIIHATLQRSTNKFLFAQVRDDFVEFLLSFLTSSLGRIEHLLSGKTSLQNIDNIYRSVKDSIESDYFMSSDIRNRLINPELAKGLVSENQILPLGEDMPPPRLYHPPLCKYFTCREGPSRYLKKKTMYIVSDNLTLTPHSISSCFSILNSLGIPLSDVRETELHIGPQEALSILKASLTSKTAMSDALLLKKVPKQEP